MNVVVTDDEKHIADGLAKLIGHVDERCHVIACFYDSQETLQWFETHKKEADLLVTDICMPGMDGLELCQRVREKDAGVQCVILTGFGEFDYAKRAIDIGVMGYLLKPVDTAELREILEKALNAPKTDVPLTRMNEPREVRMMRESIRNDCRGFSITAFADQIRMNADYLSRLFKQHTGMTIGDFLTETRLMKAAGMLDDPAGFKIYEVCEAVGYTDQPYFSRIFKRRFGMTPKEYQKFGKR